MSRDRGTINTGLWADDDWRELSLGAQWLYEYLLTCASLNSCGVADWRPARISGMNRTLTKAMVEEYADELEQGFFIVRDDETEEVAIRSFFRHDGILQQPNVMIKAAREFAGIASASIRGVIVHELKRLREEFPEGQGKSNVWASAPQWEPILKGRAIDVREGSGNVSHIDPERVGGNPSGNPSSLPIPVPIPVPDASHLRDDGGETETPKGRSTRLPASWSPTAEHIASARARGVDVIAEAERFRLHAEANDRRAVRWNAAFSMWLTKAVPTLPATASGDRLEDWQLR